ncbi:MAG: hypothetical protein K1W20_02390 [Lachnospiraceae bacterium]
MRILVLWRQCAVDSKMRKTDIDHAFSLYKYDTKNEYFYFNIYNGRFAEDYSWIEEKMFDAVIFHYTAMELRGLDQRWNNFLQLMTNVWREYPCKKVIMAQDDYKFTERIWNLALGIKADTIYTIIRECDHPILYPKDKMGNIKIKVILTGYVEEDYINKLHLQSHRDRKYDVVYRACKPPYNYGKHSQMKYELATFFDQKLKNTGLVCDLANTDHNKGAMLGDSWFAFLASSRITVGCLGGSGLADIKGIYWKKVAEYMTLHPEASYEETKAACFPEVEENLTGVISPRIFDAAITRTCQVLIGEDYQDILRPGTDYIVLDKGFGNINEVTEKMKDIDYCEEIANNCYERVVKSQNYTYAKLAKQIADDMGQIDHEKMHSDELSKYIEGMCKKNNETVMDEIRLKGIG